MVNMSFRQFINLMIGIGVFCSLFLVFYLVRKAEIENNAINNVEKLCKWQWNNFRSYGKMTQGASINQGDPLYIYRCLEIQGIGYNASVVSAQPKENGMSSFVGLAFAPTGTQKNYVCDICKSHDSNVTPNTSTMIRGTILDCPRGYFLLKRIE
jgi:hypothetical protein